MAEIIPSIIAQDFSEIKDKIAKLNNLVAWVELDIVDGVFAPNITWPFQLRQAPDELKEVVDSTKISAHLMIESPETVIEDWQEVVDRIVVHYEAVGELDKIIENIGPHVSLSIALELDTPVEKIYSYLDKVKTVHLMSIARLGYYGEKFDERVFEKIKTLKANWPDVKIIVDGGIDLVIAKKLIDAGANGLVVGSHIWQAENIEEEIKKFQNL